MCDGTKSSFVWMTRNWYLPSAATWPAALTASFLEASPCLRSSRLSVITAQRPFIGITWIDSGAFMVDLTFPLTLLKN